MTEAYRILYLFVLVTLGILILVLLVRAARTPRYTDRIICVNMISAMEIICVNMISAMVIVMIGVLCMMLREGYLMDAALLYAAMSFLAVVVFCRIWLGTGKKKEEGKEEDKSHV